MGFKGLKAFEVVFEVPWDRRNDLCSIGIDANLNVADKM